MVCAIKNKQLGKKIQFIGWLTKKTILVKIQQVGKCTWGRSYKTLRIVNYEASPVTPYVLAGNYSGTPITGRPLSSTPL